MLGGQIRTGRYFLETVAVTRRLRISFLIVVIDNRRMLSSVAGTILSMASKLTVCNDAAT